MRKLLLILLLPSVMLGATINRYVNTASTPGGNGTTNATTGDNRAYKTMNEGEAAESAGANGNLTDNGGDVLKFNCSGVDADTTTVTIDGYTTSATCYIWVLGDNNTGRKSASNYRINPPDNYTGITVSEDFSIVENIEVLGWQGAKEGILVTNCSSVTVKNCLAHTPSGTSYSGIALIGNYHKAINCISYGIAGDNGFWAQPSIALKCEFYNCVAWGNTNGFGGTNNYPVCFNCISGGNSGRDFSSAYAGLEARNNISEDTTAPTGGAEITGATFTADTNQTSGSPVIFTNLTAGSEDFHLQESVGSQANVAINAGYDASAIFTTDIDGETRTGTWDIGADEYVAPAPSVPFLPQVMIWEN